MKNLKEKINLVVEDTKVTLYLLMETLESNTGFYIYQNWIYEIGNRPPFYPDTIKKIDITMKELISDIMKFDEGKIKEKVQYIQDIQKYYLKSIA